MKIDPDGPVKPFYRASGYRSAGACLFGRSMALWDFVTERPFTDLRLKRYKSPDIRADDFRAFNTWVDHQSVRIRRMYGGFCRDCSYTGMRQITSRDVTVDEISRWWQLQFSAISAMHITSTAYRVLWGKGQFARFCEDLEISQETMEKLTDGRETASEDINICADWGLSSVDENIFRMEPGSLGPDEQDRLRQRFINGWTAGMWGIIEKKGLNDTCKTWEEGQE